MKTLRTLALALACCALARADALAIPAALGICPYPPEAADIMKEAIPVTLGAPEDAPGDCEKLCAKWFAACKAAVGGARKCQATMIGKYVAIEQAACKTFVDEDVAKMCKGNVKAFGKTLKQETKDDHAFALGCCEDNVGGCIGTCQGLVVALRICDQ